MVEADELMMNSNCVRLHSLYYTLMHVTPEIIL